MNYKDIFVPTPRKRLIDAGYVTRLLDVAITWPNTFESTEQSKKMKTKKQKRVKAPETDA